MLTADVNLNEFNRRLSGITNYLGVNLREKVMRHELGQLVKTLVKISPPKDVGKSRRSVKNKVNKTFDAWEQQDNKFATDSTKASATGLKYWAANKKYLYAGAADSDLRGASLQELRAVFYRTRKLSGSRRLIVPFHAPRKLQQVAISTKILTDKNQRAALGAKIAGNFGRLKAAWLVPVKTGAVALSGKFLPPQWVTKHLAGARGSFINGLNQPDHPHFTLINRAKGVTGRASKYFVSQALKIRAEAMKKNLELVLKGVKEYRF